MSELDADVVAVVCPECGAPAQVRAGRRTSGDFCPSCDYPLFWARPPAPDAGSGPTDDARRRAPGASGSALAATLACPECAELNVPTAERCVRCGADLTPPPPAPEPAPPPPAEVVYVEQRVEVPVPCDHLPTWLVVLLTAMVTVPLTLLVLWLFWRN